MDYKKIAECVRLCGSTPKIHECQEKCSYYCGRDMSKCIPRMTSDAANAIEELLDTVEAMKHPHIKIQIDYEELTIKEVCDRLERLKKERDKAVETLKNSAHTFKFCDGCKHFGEKCSVSYYWCDDGSENHWEWEGLDG